MSVANENTRVQVTMSKELQKELKASAKLDNRSLSNYIVNILLKENKI